MSLNDTAVSSYITELETALQGLLDCFEPTSPPEVCTEDGDYVPVDESLTEAIEFAERVLRDGDKEDLYND